jgi:tRNA dimethylallyltransferase
MQNPIIVLSGPTASGKTAMSFELAKKYNGEIVAIDSMTVYRGMDIGTDKPTLDKTATNKGGIFYINGIAHHLIDIVEPNQEMNAAILKNYAKKAIAEIHKSGKVPILVGGSTLYIDAIVYDYKMPPVASNPELRQRLESQSVEELFLQLAKLDPDCEWTIDRHNKRRVIRALEVVMATGKPFASQKSQAKLPKNVLYLALSRNREELYQKINQRVDQMMEMGFLDEVKRLRQDYDNNTAMQAAGYKQLGDFLDGRSTLAEAVDKTKTIHRNFAKRQITWLKRNSDIIWVSTAAEADKAVKDFLT